jgi:TamB, inner membrane protein subunit of TAM complex
MKSFRSAIRTAITLLTSGLILVAWLNTQTGLILSLRFIQTFGNFRSLHIQAIEGCLLGPIQLKGLTYRNEDAFIQIDHLYLDWDWHQLRHGLFFIRSLIVKDTQIQINQHQASSFKTPNLLRSIRWKSIQINQLTLMYRALRLDISGNVTNHYDGRWQINQAVQGTITGPLLNPHITLKQNKNLSIQNWNMNGLDANLHLELNKKLIDGTLTIQKLQNTPTMINPIQIQLSGNLNPLNLRILLNVRLKDPHIDPAYLTLQGLLKNQTIVWNGQLTAGQAKGNLNGHTHLQDLTTLLQMSVQNLTIKNSRYHVLLQGQFSLTGNDTTMSATGDCWIPQGKLVLDQNNQDLISLSKDIVFVDEPKEATSFPINSRITIHLGPEVDFNYGHLHSRIKGKILLVTLAKQPSRVFGQIQLHGGFYDYYGQILHLQPNCAFNFNDSTLDNPNLNLLVTKTVLVTPITNDFSIFSPTAPTSLSELRAAQVGLQIQGPAQQLRISLYADPANLFQSQLDILSYLLTNQPAQFNANAQLLLQAATQLDRSKNLLTQLTRSVQATTGLDQLGIGSKPIFDPTTNRLDPNLSIILGKQLSSKLFISYSLGLLKPISVLQINYLLNRHFSIQNTNSNFAQGIDLLYTLDR